LSSVLAGIENIVHEYHVAMAKKLAAAANKAKGVAEHSLPIGGASSVPRQKLGVFGRGAIDMTDQGSEGGEDGSKEEKKKKKKKKKNALIKNNA
jgi:hypothetical protein